MFNGNIHMKKRLKEKCQNYDLFIFVIRYKSIPLNFDKIYTNLITLYEISKA